ncbi:MAG: hypothetical protein R2682_01980 [Pyrinomonadaceae bacterium]
MTPEERLKIYVAWTQEPQLSQAEISELLAMSQITDSSGVIPGGVGYVPTYDLRRAAKEGWSWKMGKCSDMVSSDMDGDRMSSNQLFDHCQTMRRRYMGTASPKVGPGYTADDDDVFGS